MLTTFQPSDLDDFSAIPAKWRNRFDLWSNALRQLSTGARTKQEVCKSVGCSLSTLNRKLTAIETHGWRGLIPNYKGAVQLNQEFVRYWKNLQEDYQRKTRPAIRELYRRWQRRDPIDGYAGHPGWPELPRGWDARNLYRYQPTKLELTALRQGLGAATARHAPKILSTRVGLHHLSHIAFDDVWLDMQTHLLTRRQQVRVLQIGALDVRSGCRFSYGTKPRIIRDDGTRDGLNESEMRFALASVLYNHGISPLGTTFLVEHGTAAIRDRVRDILKRGLGDKIIIPDSGMTGKLQLIAGMHEGRGGGNPRHKSHLESLHNLLHNEFAALPGQTGHDRNEPEWLHGMTKEVKWLFNVAKNLPPSALVDLQFPTREYYSQLLPIIHAMHEVINRRDWHDLEGWAESGFLTTDYRILPTSNEWISQHDFLALPAPARQAYSIQAQADPRCARPRKLSPREVYDLGASRENAIEKVPHGLIAEILYQDLAQPRTCRDGSFKIEDTTIHPEPMFFESRITRPDGRQEELRDRETYEVVLNPFDSRALWVFSGARQKGAFLGIAQRVQRVRRDDAEAIQKAFGRQHQRMADLTKDQKTRHATSSNGLTRRTLKRITHNTTVITAARQAQADFTALATASMDAALPADDTDADAVTTLTNNSHEDTQETDLTHW